MSNQNPCNSMMADGRGPSLHPTDWRQQAEYNFHQFPDAQSYRHYLQNNASKILARIKGESEPSQCAAPNRPFQTTVKWNTPVTKYQSIRTQQVYR